jgi:hypothetical protein
VAVAGGCVGVLVIVGVSVTVLVMVLVIVSVGDAETVTLIVGVMVCVMEGVAVFCTVVGVLVIVSVNVGEPAPVVGVTDIVAVLVAVGVPDAAIVWVTVRVMVRVTVIDQAGLGVCVKVGLEHAFDMLTVETIVGEPFQLSSLAMFDQPQLTGAPIMCM